MKDRKEGFLDSFLDAFRVGNIFLRILQFVFFGLVTATPYVIRNLDQVAQRAQESGATGFMVVFAYFKALMGAVWAGVGIGLSTLFDTIIHFNDVLANRQIGTIIFSILVLIFATWMLYQPIRLLFNILDMQPGRAHSKSLIMVIALAVTLVIAAPLSFLLSGGETITSGIEDADQVSEPGNTNNQTAEIVNDSGNESDSLTNSLNMLTGG